MADDGIQATIGKDVTLDGVGLHTGEAARVVFKPAPPDTGIVFERVDLEGRPRVRARVENVTGASRGTTVTEGDVSVHTVEHLCAAATGLGIDNLLVEISGPEPPATDGSSAVFARALLEAGVAPQGVPRKVITLDQPFDYKQDGAEMTIVPEDKLRISFTIKFDHPYLKSQFYTFDVGDDNFVDEIAPARTFALESEIEMLRRAGLIKGGSLECAVVVGDKGPLNPDGFRFDDEPVRHKILDLIGDLTLFGARFHGHIIAMRSGHAVNVGMIRSVKRYMERKRGVPSVEPSQSLFDINYIMKCLPHRYPFLLVDRIVDYSPGEYIIGIKNVTINEPFFNGHFPGAPVMPGVLIIEAMGQVGGVLLMQTVENPEDKLIYLIGLDKVKLRRPVMPGDQLVFKLVPTKFKGRIGVMRGQAFVGDNVVAEGEFKACLVEKNGVEDKAP
ncbi:MAG: UDP-3-O-acyl-N-acetylglucosamine deacetylase [Candidatus Zixiibacteriota bacterium]|jgi:UDP-3-O-[3-hydroxymyristoyl] N-acetylglucosamine deacetylase/3-hydroxyacyl-[acyl-carrier-protein] dehydratase